MVRISVEYTMNHEGLSSRMPAKARETEEKALRERENRADRPGGEIILKEI